MKKLQLTRQQAYQTQQNIRMMVWHQLGQRPQILLRQVQNHLKGLRHRWSWCQAA